MVSGFTMRDYIGSEVRKLLDMDEVVSDLVAVVPSDPSRPGAPFRSISSSLFSRVLLFWI